MQSFNEVLRHFQQNESNSSQVMEQAEEDQQQTSSPLQLRSGTVRRRAQQVPCVSVRLYEVPPQSSFFPVQMIYDVVHFVLIFIAKLVPGQWLFTIFDYYMNKVEKTLDYCVPTATDIDYHHSDADRPMTWILFIPALIILRILRFHLSVISIMLGYGEITSQDMKRRVTDFRRYYRSIRHFAVKAKSQEEKEKISQQKKYIFWRIYYGIMDLIFMSEPLPQHSNGSAVSGASNETELKNGNSRLKRSLNQVEEDDIFDELNTVELLEKYAEEPDTSSMDPDYVVEDDQLSEANSTETDSDEEKTESQKRLNDGTTQGYSSDNDGSLRDKSKNENCFTLDPSQLTDLETELVTKILKHFKDTYNLPSPSVGGDEIFYSPIGSPVEKGYNSEPERSLKVNSKSPNQAKQIEHQET